jgi:transcriptional regulator with XRE-family HTH domain
MGRPERTLHPERSALDRFGYVLRKWRKRRGLSLARLGAHALVSRGMIQLIEVAEREPSYDVAQRCEAALEAGGEIMEAWRQFAEPYDTAAGQPESPFSADSLDDIVRRRAFLLNAVLLAGASATDPGTALEATRRSLTEAFPGRHDADVGEWNEIAWEYGETYAVTAPADLLRTLLVDFVGLQEAFKRFQRGNDQNELYRASALLGGFIAATASNLGYINESRRWWRTARYAADRAGDSFSPLWVRAREVTHAMDERPAGAVIRLIEDAAPFEIGAPSEVALDLLAGKVQTLALAGRESDAEKALAQLNERFSASSFAGYNGSLLAWGEERLHNTEIFTCSRLGNYRRLENAQKAASALYKYDPSNLRWPAANELHKAFCLARNGDIGGGTNHARMVIEELPPTQRAPYIYASAQDVLTAVPQCNKNLPAVREYREWLNSADSAPPSQPVTLPVSAPPQEASQD